MVPLSGRRHDNQLTNNYNIKKIDETKLLTKRKPPDIPLEVDYDNNPTKLYLAICECNWANAAAIIAKNPIEAKTWVVRRCNNQPTNAAWRFLPLHSACARQPPGDVIESLLQVYSEAARLVDDQGMLPLHYACGNNASDTVVNMLLIANPFGAKEPDPRAGKLPLHYICQLGSSAESILYMLLSIYPGAIHVRDKNGCTPIDLANQATLSQKKGTVNTLNRCASVLSTIKALPSQRPIFNEACNISVNKTSSIEIDQFQQNARLTDELKNVKAELKMLQGAYMLRQLNVGSSLEERDTMNTLVLDSMGGYSAKGENAAFMSKELQRIKEESDSVKRGSKIMKSKYDALLMDSALMKKESNFLKRKIERVEKESSEYKKQSENMKESIDVERSTFISTVTELKNLLSQKKTVNSVLLSKIKALELENKTLREKAETISITPLDSSKTMLLPEDPISPSVNGQIMGNISKDAILHEDKYKTSSVSSVDQSTSTLQQMIEKEKKTKSFTSKWEAVIMSSIKERQKKMEELAQIEEHMLHFFENEELKSLIPND